MAFPAVPPRGLAASSWLPPLLELTIFPSLYATLHRSIHTTIPAYIEPSSSHSTPQCSATTTPEVHTPYAPEPPCSPSSHPAQISFPFSHAVPPSTHTARQKAWSVTFAPVSHPASVAIPAKTGPSFRHFTSTISPFSHPPCYPSRLPVVPSPWTPHSPLTGLPQHPIRAATSAATPVKAEPTIHVTAPMSPNITFPPGDDKAHLTPSAVVGLLDKYIIGQDEAKRAVAIALRNRWRRHKIPGEMRDEIMPKNILMIGPTGCGKTEIARRLAKLADAPFIKVEATKYTELGFVGRDVDDIIKDLVENSILLTRQKLKAQLQRHLDKAVEDRILTALCGASADESTLRSFRDKYRQGVLDNITVELDVSVRDPSSQAFTLHEGMLMFQDGFKKSMGPKKEKREMKVQEARSHLEEAEAERLLPQELIAQEAVKAAEDDGIVFIDEIDKIVDSQSRLFGGNVSSEGVQRDLLPIVEGCTVSTKYGNVSTDHMLFICSGAFHSSKPSDMLAELQGRLPIRVELKGLNAQHFFRILTEPENNMVKQQQVLLATEGVDLSFTEGAVRAIARVAEEANKLLDNIGARRLHTVMERILSDISYSAPERVKENGGRAYKYTVDEEYVMLQMSGLLKKQDLSKYVL